MFLKLLDAMLMFKISKSFNVFFTSLRILLFNVVNQNQYIFNVVATLMLARSRCK